MFDPTAYFPVYNEDPFLKYRPFPAAPANFYEKHWHEIAFSFVFYFTIQQLSPVVSRRVFGRVYTDLNKKNQINFDIHVVSQVQCIISILGIIPCWNHPLIKNHWTDPEGSILGYFPFGGLLASISIGYFLWDVYVCSRYFHLFGVGFLFHGAAALYVFGTALLPFCLPWISAFLVFELSTPFVNMNWFASKLPKGVFSERFIVINGLLLMFTFFMVRIVWGFYAVTLVAKALYATRAKLHPVLPVVLLSINVLLDCLNVFWFYKMVTIAIKKTKGSSKAKAE